MRSLTKYNGIELPLGLAARVSAVLLAFVLLAGCGDAGAPATTEAEVSVPVAAAEDPVPAERDVAKRTAADIAARIKAEKGHVVVINFWATWCAPCVEEMPELAAFYSAHSGEGLTFLSYTVDHPTTVEDAVIPFLEERKIPFPVGVVDEPNPDALIELFGGDFNGAVPATFVYDTEGKQVAAWYEKTMARTLWETVEPLLAPAQ